MSLGGDSEISLGGESEKSEEFLPDDYDEEFLSSYA